MKIFQLLDLIIKLFRLNKDKKAKVIIFGLLSYHAQVQSQIASAFWLGTSEVIEIPCDDNYDKVSLLLHMDGTNTSTVFLDNSVNDFIVTPSGNARISNAQSVFGGTSASFDGTGDFLTITSNTAFNYSTGDFTIEGWIRNAAATTTRRTIFSQSSGTSVSGLIIETYANVAGNPNRVYFGGYSSGTTVFNLQSVEININQWYHFAAVKSGTTYSLYINGVLQQSSTTATVIPYDNKNVVIGALTDNTGRDYFGFIDEVRITKGLARYTSNFTVPTAAFENADCEVVEPVVCDEYYYSNSLLLHMDGANNSTTFTDNSINNFSVTPFGNAKISTAQSKFGGASGYFDGNGDYLFVPVSSAFAFNGDFTVEAWVYLLQLNNVGAASYVCDFRTGGSNNLTLGIINNNGNGRMYVYMGGVDRVGSINFVNGTWNHIAFVRSGSSITLYLNGISNGVLSSSFSQSSTSLRIASQFAGSLEFFNGYIDDLRITKGVARYTSNFTPPTAPFEDVSCTQLWDGSQTGILDNYPGAAAAYSVRALNSNYTGPLMTIRRASDNAETDVYALANGDLDQALINSFCTGSSCTVKTLYDQSGNGNNCTQLTLGSQPLIYTGGSVITQNGKAAFQFDGTDDILVTNNSYAYGSVISMISVARIITNKTYSRILSANSDIYAFLGTAASPFYIASFFGNGTTWGTVTAQSTVTWNQQRLVISIAESTNYLYIDNSAAITRSNPMGSYTGKFDIGGSTGTPSQNGNSNIQEIIIYPNTQRSNITGIRSNINTYFSIY